MNMIKQDRRVLGIVHTNSFEKDIGLSFHQARALELFIPFSTQISNLVSYSIPLWDED